MADITGNTNFVRREMVLNFKVWAVFTGLQLVLLIFALVLHRSQPYPKTLNYLAYLFTIVGVYYSFRLPKAVLKYGPFKFHNDAERLQAYRVQLLAALALAFCTGLLLLAMMFWGVPSWQHVFFWLIPFYRLWRLKPGTGVWLDFRMTHRAGRIVE